MVLLSTTASAIMRAGSCNDKSACEDEVSWTGIFVRKGVALRVREKCGVKPLPLSEKHVPLQLREVIIFLERTKSDADLLQDEYWR
jgi:hypothetical protein